MGSAIPGHPQSDAYEHLQGYWWVADSLASGHLPWEARHFGLPDGGVLWFPDLLGALAALPFTLTIGAPVAYTLVACAQVWGALLGGYALGVHVGGSRASGLLAAVIFGASPLVLGLLHSGVSEYLHLAAFPLLWIAAERALARGGGWVVAAGVAWAALGWANAYYAMFGAAVPLLAWAASAQKPAWRPAAVRLLATAAVAGVLVLPVAWIIRASVADPAALLRQESAPGWDWVYLPANDLAAFLLPGDQLFPDFRDNGNFGIRHVSYLGWVAMGLAVLGGRRWGPPLLIAGVLALGPSLHWRGQPVRIGGRFVPLPAALLYLPGSPFRAVHHPYRLTVLPMLVLAAAAADALRRRPRAAVGAAALVLGESLAVSPGGWPVDSAPLDEVPALPEAGGVWELPPDFRALNRRWLGHQAVHGRPVPYTINVFMPAAWRSNQLYQTVMACLDHPERHTIARDARPPLGVWLRHDSAQDLRAGVHEVRGWGLRYVVLHSTMNSREQACVVKHLEVVGAAEVEAGPGMRAFDLDAAP